jgi:arsenical pump membrane protein
VTDLLDELVHRVLPVLVFLVGITLVAELSEIAGVFEVASSTAARWARGRVWVLWALVVLLATACTVVLSLDTTAVLLTPVVLTLASRLKVSTAAFAMTTVWLANTASLLLPVSNLTNLLSLHRMHELGVGIGGYVRLTWAPALVAVLVTVLVLAALFWRDLLGHYETAPPRVPHDRLLLVCCATVCLLLGPAFVTGVNVAWPASGAAVLLLGLFAWRDRSRVTWTLLPWRAVVVVTVLFTVVFVLGRLGLSDLLASVAGGGETFGDYLRLAATAALAANVIDNLPAYLALEPAAGDSPVRLVAVLIGVNCGPLLTFWASLATLLWRERCRARDVPVRWWVFALRGLLLVPLLLVACTAALAIAT